MIVRMAKMLLPIVSVILAPFVLLAAASLLVALYSVLFRPVSLSFRLYGDLYRGDSTIARWAGSLFSLPSPLVACCILIGSALLLFAVSRLPS
jgi:F0F1-type ATP synthase membrane subunit a